jgi:CRP-like cAMP-binding protein
MNEDFFLKTRMFHDMTKEDLARAFSCLNYYQRSYSKSERILTAGQDIRFMGMVLKGSVTVERNDRWGNRTILTEVDPGECFGEMYAMTPGIILPVDVIAAKDCTIAFFEVSQLLEHDCSAHEITGKLTENLLRIALHKNLILSNRSFHTAPKTIRGKVMAYLNTMSLQQRSLDVTIPFNRQQLADYLNIDRTALSKELGKMKEDGLIDFWKSHFRLLADAED